MNQWMRTAASALKIQRVEALALAKKRALRQSPSGPNSVSLKTKRDKIRLSVLRPLSEENTGKQQLGSSIHENSDHPEKLLQELRGQFMAKRPNDESKPSPHEEYSSITAELSGMVNHDAESDDGSHFPTITYADCISDVARELLNENRQQNSWTPLKITLNPSNRATKELSSLSDQNGLEQALESPQPYREILQELLSLESPEKPAPNAVHTQEGPTMRLYKSETSHAKTTAENKQPAAEADNIPDQKLILSLLD